ncbi:hypothetical protein CY34DRAFT_810420 [Suillus luteus UH-Slu-Lm8-n1]|uniref:Uncharacterized protein n=1 Tax=Suillus luteus UH-Slu-Lm8-n1 TaxID=930992 RepID=A0A0D0A6Z8_9AGAM|nr:hypothetical protein CY34DRAFT_810420 [Suillus luteus UH-Slu-Lm8-n1]
MSDGLMVPLCLCFVKRRKVIHGEHYQCSLPRSLTIPHFKSMYSRSLSASSPIPSIALCHDQVIILLRTARDLSCSIISQAEFC